MRIEVRIAFGTPTERRSTVWKFWVRGDGAYILTRMMGRDAKVSLHATGQGSWSGTSNWVQSDPSRRNRDRHFGRWMFTRPTGNMAERVFRILVPEAEMRKFSAAEAGDIHWIEAPPQGETFALDCFITPPTENMPRPNAAPYIHVVSMPFRDGRWFVIQLTQVHVSNNDIVGMRAAMRQLVDAAGFELLEDHRSIFFSPGGETCPFLVEVAAIAATSQSHLDSIAVV